MISGNIQGARRVSTIVATALLVLHGLTGGGLVQVQAHTEADCTRWASIGECEKNPSWMWENCKAACTAVSDNDVMAISSFYDLSAKDIDGNDFNFSELKGKTVVIANVASYCGYTDQHYKELIALHRKLKDLGRLEILAFPCNQFGEQEPDKCSAIKEFTDGLGVEFRMMDKVDVNGGNTHLVYKYLKKMAGPPEIEWNFATYFIIGPEGAISSFSNVSPIRLQGKVKSLLKLSSEL